MSDKIPMEQVYREYSKMIFKFLLSKTGDENVAEELTQETFYRAIKNAEKFDFTCKVSTWLCSIAKNICLEYMRKNPVMQEMNENYEHPIGLEDSYLEKEGRMRILTAIHNMPDPAREVLHLRLLSDLSFSEIGSIMNKSEEWARVTYYRAKIKLRKELENYGQD